MTTRQYHVRVRNYDTFPPQQYLQWNYRMVDDTVQTVVAPYEAEVFTLEDGWWVRIAAPDPVYDEDGELIRTERDRPHIIAYDGVFAVQVAEQDGDPMRTYFTLANGKVKIDVPEPPDTKGWETRSRFAWGHAGDHGTSRWICGRWRWA